MTSSFVKSDEVSIKKGILHQSLSWKKSGMTWERDQESQITRKFEPTKLLNWAWKIWSWPSYYFPLSLQNSDASSSLFPYYSAFRWQINYVF